MQSQLSNLINTILSQAQSIEDTNDNRIPFESLLLKSIDKTMLEIREGADVDEFSELVIVNLLLLGDKEGYSSEELHDFVYSIKSEKDD